MLTYAELALSATKEVAAEYDGRGGTLGRVFYDIPLPFRHTWRYEVYLRHTWSYERYMLDIPGGMRYILGMSEIYLEV
jgi:hypothetical protein